MARRKRRSGKKKKMFNLRAIGYLFVSFWTFIFAHIGYLIIVGVGVLIIFGMREYCYSNPLFDVSVVAINNTHHLSRDFLVEQSRLRKGTNIFQVNLKRASSNLEQLPRIKRAEVFRHLPNAIDITITELVEVAQIKLPYNHTYYLIDRAGVVLDPVLSKPRPDLVLIEVQSSQGKRLVPGRQFSNKGCMHALQFMEYIIQNNIIARDDIQRIHVDIANNVTIVQKNGIAIKVGPSLSAVQANIGKIPDILANTKDATIRYIDVRFKDIVIKKR